MPKFVINGDFLCRNLTGIERFAYEVCLKLDELVEPDFLGIFIPKNAKTIPSFKNIKVFVSEKNIKSFPRWSLFNYGSFLRKQKAVGIDFSNTCSIQKPGVVFLHDIYCKVFPEDFNGFRDNLVRLYSCFMYRFVAKHSKKLLTVSNYSKKQIATTYKIEESSIDVIPNVLKNPAVVLKSVGLPGTASLPQGSIRPRSCKRFTVYALSTPRTCSI